MINAGGLLRLHYHLNKNVLDLFTEVSGVLYYNNSPLFSNISISQESHNYLTQLQDGLFVDGTFIDRFDYHDNELYFDNIIVSREYTNQSISDSIDELWVNNPYHDLGVIDLTYWFKTIYSSDKVQTYQNTSDMNMNLKITNPQYQLLNITIDEETTNNSLVTINIVLEPNSTISIKEAFDEDLDITVELV